MPIIRCEGLGKTFRIADKQPGLAGTLRHLVRRRTRDVEAVKAVSFTVEPGEMVGFLGPNGAGKTTTLKMLSGLIHPSAGRAEVAGFLPQRRQADFLSRITLVMGQKQQLIWDLPPLDSLRVNAAIYGIPDREAKRRIDELAEMLELGPELTRPVRKLSLGQRMKAELLAALSEGSPSISTSAAQMAEELPGDLVEPVNQQLRELGCGFQVQGRQRRAHRSIEPTPARTGHRTSTRAGLIDQG